MTRVFQLMLAMTMAFGAMPAPCAEPSVLGPPPDWNRYKALGEAAVRALLPDPQNWAIEWPNGYADYGVRPTSRWHGWTTCGIIRANTPVSGRNPVTSFIIVIDHDQVRNIRISGKDSNSAVNIGCALAVRRGQLPPARMMGVGGRPLADEASLAAIAQLGLSVRPVPEGAYVVTIVPGSPAAAVSLQPGMVITRVNGIALAGLGTAMTNILASDQSAFDIETATGQHLRVIPTKSGSAKP